ncbi:hydrolase [Mesobacillus campisalis]|uniref:Hydrolase n=1 Tax=Mesobacillus campisalis TaxID=1408103 RepID=A0A0M2T166_9BACI|nr:Cof-type HAD-IIB family hydrolase [Mesobacillus campisalis]KKK38570.1 hydrolase [Mesobacillus campisalis]
MNCYSIDLDGTLLDSNQDVSEENIKALTELQEQGHCIILNTGRAVGDVIKIKALDNLKVPIFCVNGSILYSKDRELLYEATIPVGTYQELFPILRKLEVGILVYTNHGGYPSTLPPLHGKSKEELDTLFGEFDYDAILALPDLKIYKIIALVHYDELARIDEVKKALDGKYNLSMASSFPNNVEITSGDAHKGKALLRYQKMMSLSFNEIIAFGDGGNDLAQFEVATTSVAMANAPLHIQQEADIITKNNDEDGVAHAIRNLLPAKDKDILNL